MSNNELEIYTENYSKLIELMVEYHNHHIKYVKYPSKPLGVKMRIILKDIRLLELELRRNIKPIFTKAIAEGNRSKKDASLPKPPRKKDGKFDTINKDPV